ncbi:MAG: hypothetical protein JSU93_04385 [Methanobacteriota archaeon]|nr:MAG: hypothetical protein JSU93_04385 [Euryarchaeota archaeon]
MAKKRKKDKAKKEEEYEFKPPEFDEKEFLRKELRDTKTVLLTVGYAACLGLIAAVLSSVSSKLIGISFLLVFAGLYSLKYFYPFIRVDTSEFQKKNWAGNVAWFFFTFLAVWVLTFNYPVADHASPTVEDVAVWITDNGTGDITTLDYKYLPSTGSYTWVPRVGDSYSLQAGVSYTLNVSARISDNGVLVLAEIALGSVTSEYSDMIDEGENRYGYVVDELIMTSGQSFLFFIHAEDDRGNEFTFIPVTGISAA